MNDEYILNMFNTMTLSELTSFKGIGRVIGHRIIEQRPILHLKSLYAVKALPSAVIDRMISSLAMDHEKSFSETPKSNNISTTDPKKEPNEDHVLIVIDTEADDEVVSTNTKTLDEVLQEKYEKANQLGDVIDLLDDSDSDEPTILNTSSNNEAVKKMKSLNNQEESNSLLKEGNNCVFSSEQLLRARRNREQALQKLLDLKKRAKLNCKMYTIPSWGSNEVDRVRDGKRKSPFTNDSSTNVSK